MTLTLGICGAVADPCVGEQCGERETMIVLFWALLNGPSLCEPLLCQVNPKLPDIEVGVDSSQAVCWSESLGSATEVSE